MDDAIPSIGGYRRNDVEQNCTSSISEEIPARIGSRETQQSTTQPNTSESNTCTVKKSQKRYSEQLLQDLLTQIKNGSLTMYQVTKYYGIPRSTLQFRLGKKCKQHGKSGRMPVVLPDEERTICKWLSEMERKGFLITRQRLQLKIASYLKENPRPNPFKGNVPGRRWIEAFLRRHPQFSMRTLEPVTVESARVSEDGIRRWFDTIYNYLDSHDLLGILKDPSRILNGDESGFSFQPNSKRVIGTKGKKNVPTVEPGNAKQDVTVMYTFAADGTVIPPHVILPYKRLTKDLIQSFPGDWGIGTSASGVMDTLNFVEYIKKVLYPTLLRNKTSFPVLYFVDGDKSHMAFEAAEICEKLGIILLALCPNTTCILQPADVAVFRPLKNSWTDVIDEWKSEDQNNTVTMLNFGTLLTKANAIALKQSTIVNGFRACGLFPFDQNAVDYSILARKHAPVKAGVSQKEAPPVVSIPVSVLEEAKTLIGQEKIQFLYSIPFEYMSQADKALFFILENILSQGEPTQAIDDCPEPGMPSPPDMQEASVISNTQEQSTLFEDDDSVDALEYTCDSLKVESFETEATMDIGTNDPGYVEENVLNNNSPVLPTPSPSSIVCETVRELIPWDITSSDNKDIFKMEYSDDDAYGYEQLQNDTVGSGICKICHSVLMPDAKNLLQYAAMDKTYKDVVQETLNIQVHFEDDEIIRICEKCNNFIKDLHSFVILCREGLSRTVDKTPHSPISKFQTTDDEYDYDKVSSEEPVPNQQRDFKPVITIVHDKLRLMPVSHSDMKDPLNPLDTDSKEASASENVDQHHPITCTICGKVNNNKVQLLEHMNLHTKKIKYPCQYCEKVFYASRMHRNHELTHLDKLNIYMRCDECGSVYTSSKQLYVHLQLKH